MRITRTSRSFNVAEDKERLPFHATAQTASFSFSPDEGHLLSINQPSSTRAFKDDSQGIPNGAFEDGSIKSTSRVTTELGPFEKERLFLDCHEISADIALSELGGSDESSTSSTVTINDHSESKPNDILTSAKPDDVVFRQSYQDTDSEGIKKPIFYISTVPATSLASLATITSNHSYFEPTEILLKYPLHQRKGWKTGSVFQMVSVAIGFGLGTLWRFTSLAFENSAGSFVFAYLICWLLIGLPVLILEQLVGQFSSKDLLKVWTCSPIFRGVAVTQCIISVYLLSMFNILIAWSGVYFATSFPQPWPLSQSCLNWYNSSATIASSNISTAECYFEKDILNLSDLNSISSADWRAIIAVLISSFFVTLLCIYQLKIFEKVTPILAALILCWTLGLLVYSCLQDGAADGISYFFTPQWDNLNSTVWYSALTQVLYTHYIGLGVNLTLSKFNGFKWPIVRYSIISSFTAMAFTLFSGLTIFALLGNLASSMNMDIRDSVTLGYGLIYIVVSNAVVSMPSPQICSAIIFAVLFLCGIMTPAVYVINIVTVLKARFRTTFKRDWMAILPVVVLGWLLSILFTSQGGLYFLKVFDAYGVSIPALICLGLEVIGFLWIYGIILFQRDFKLMTDSRSVWMAYFSILTPIFILIVAIAAAAQFELVTLDGKEIPKWAHGIGGGLMVLAVLPILLWMVYAVWTQLGYGLFEKIQMATKHTTSWGPSEYQHRHTWLEHKVESWHSDGRSTLEKKKNSVSNYSVENVQSDDIDLSSADDHSITRPTSWEMY